MKTQDYKLLVLELLNTIKDEKIDEVKTKLDEIEGKIDTLNSKIDQLINA